MSKKVIVAGHICLDVTPIFPENKVNNLSEILNPGKLIHMNRADVHTGGAVANTGLGMKVLGADVSLMGKVGKDAFGDMVLHILKEYHAEDGMLSMDGESTSYSVVIAVPGIDRIFLHHPGANDTFVLEDIPEEKLEDVALFHFGYPPLMQKMYEKDGEELVKLFKKMKEKASSKEEFSELLDCEMRYRFWCKCEWEIILSDWPPSDKFQKAKIDVYDQLRMNWDVFVDYVWSNI